MFKAKITEHDPINKESLEKLGWKFIEKYSTSKEVFKKDNYYLSIGSNNICRFVVEDPSLFSDIIPDPENIRLVLKIKTIQQLKQLESMLLWTSKLN